MIRNENYKSLNGTLQNPKQPKKPFVAPRSLAPEVNTPLMRPRGFFGVLGWLLVRFRFAVVLFWAVVALAAYLYLPALGDSTSSSLSDVVPESPQRDSQKFAPDPGRCHHAYGGK